MHVDEQQGKRPCSNAALGRAGVDDMEWVYELTGVGGFYGGKWRHKSRDCLESMTSSVYGTVGYSPSSSSMCEFRVISVPWHTEQ